MSMSHQLLDDMMKPRRPIRTPGIMACFLLIVMVLVSFHPVTTLAKGHSFGEQLLLPHEESRVVSQNMEILLATGTNQEFLQAAAETAGRKNFGTGGNSLWKGGKKNKGKTKREGLGKSNGKRAGSKSGSGIAGGTEAFLGTLKGGGKGKGKGGGNGGRNGKKGKKGSWGIALRSLPIWNAAKFQLKARRAAAGLKQAMAQAGTARGQALSLVRQWLAEGARAGAGADTRDMWTQVARDCVHQLSLAQLSLDRAAEILETGDADASDVVFKLSGAATMADNCQGAFDFVRRTEDAAAGDGGGSGRYGMTAQVRETAAGLRDSIVALQQQTLDLQQIATAAAAATDDAGGGGSDAAASAPPAPASAAPGDAGNADAVKSNDAPSDSSNDVAPPPPSSTQEDMAVPASPSGNDQSTSEGGPRGSTVESSPVNGQDGAAASDSRLLAESWPYMMGSVEGEVGRRRRRVQEGVVAGERGGEDWGVGDGGDIEKEAGRVEGEQVEGGEGGEGEKEMLGGVVGEAGGGEEGELAGEIVGNEKDTSSQDPYSDLDPYVGPTESSSDVSDDVEGQASDVEVPPADVDNPTASAEPAETEGQKRTPSSPSYSSLLQANGTADPPTAPPSSPLPTSPPPPPKKPPTLPPDCPKPIVRPPPLLAPFSIPRLMPNLVVAQDGSGDFTTIQ
ncbi:unnamed protein product, partial [Closterium sp. NIES-53]